jgi:hypothetical protein
MSPLDPIFWLHHCNIDRIWDSWLAQRHSNSPALASSTYLSGARPHYVADLVCRTHGTP